MSLRLKLSGQSRVELALIAVDLFVFYMEQKNRERLGGRVFLQKKAKELLAIYLVYGYNDRGKETAREVLNISHSNLKGLGTILFKRGCLDKAEGGKKYSQVSESVKNIYNIVSSGGTVELFF